MSMPQWLRRILDYHGAPYQEHHHVPVFSASHLAEAEHVSGHRVAKTVLFHARSHPVMVVLPASARVDVARVQAVLGEPDLRLASEEEIHGWFKGCEPGCVPPLRMRRDQRILMDRSLAHLGGMLFAAGTPEDAVGMRFRDWYRAVHPGVGRFAQSQPAERNGHASSVLVVEDESETNQLLCTLLQREGLACEGVLEGRQALEAALVRPPSAILLDLMLPDMSGLEMYERLRRTGSLRRIPCIVVTALDDDAARQRSQQLGADAYLLKPFLPQELVSQVQELLADAKD
jgi:CheY-like chemotaxis protein/prolyl-tRNA editing enzyme YbaK/EbsC (Cys-tRNA(Pro) deacylase)